jgi:hypothetical protein
MNTDMVARITHEVNRLWCALNEDYSQLPWSEAPDWQKDSARNGIEFVINNPHAGPSANHDNWSAVKIAEGWVYGPVKDAEAKTHPCLVAFEDLPMHQQIKDMLFRTVVLAAFGIEN